MNPAALLLMAASGFAGLGYQIVWTQQSALWLGHESAAVLAIVAAFFGGLAAGALWLGSRIERSGRPARWYAACEAAIGVWGAVLIVAMAPVSAAVLQLIGAQPAPGWQWAISFGATFLLLLPATAAMGATLPAMARVMASIVSSGVAKVQVDGRALAALYASNTLGAVIGVLATAFWLVPALGFARTAALCVALNGLCSVLALVWLPRACAPAAPVTPDPTRARAALARLACTGLLGIGYEVLVVRVLSQVTEDTVYTFAMLLAVYLAGTALGAAAYARWRSRSGARSNDDKVGDRLLCALAAACLIGTIGLWCTESIKAALLDRWGAGMAAAVGTEAMLALVAFALPTLAMGALFSHLNAQAHQAGVSFGRAIGVNTLGAAFAPWLFGVLLAPLLGPKSALLLVAAGYLALMTLEAWRRPLGWPAAGLALALAIWAPPLAFVDVPEGGRVVSYREGAMAAVSVVDDADGVATLRINNRQQEGSSATRLFDARQALLPLLLHPAPRTALFLGLGTGVTASSAAADPTLRVDAVELLPEVIEASAHFAQLGAAASRLHVMAADARRFVRTAGPRYDVIVADNFHPARSGSGALYTVEHFDAVRARLAPGGLFCQWLPLHQLDLTTLRSIVRSFLAAYPQGTAILAGNSLETPTLGLVGHAGGGLLELDRVRARLAQAAWPERPAAFGIDDEYALLGSFVAGPAALARFAGTAAANTDDRPVVAYAAPRITYVPDSLPRDRLTALLGELAIEPRDVLVAATEPATMRRLAAYWAARDRFISVGRAVRPTPDARAMLAQVREPLLAVLRSSPDFRPAYDPLLRMAGALARSDPRAGRELLQELVRTQPARDEAAAALNKLTP